MTEAWLSALFALGLGSLVAYGAARWFVNRGFGQGAAMGLIMVLFMVTALGTLWALAMLGRHDMNPLILIAERMLELLS
ncbi:MAG: hypothetical protein AAGM84_18065 [Pseudomonadota bacterium]